MAKRPFYLSIDLEDFTFDLHRAGGNQPIANPEALWSSYEVLTRYLASRFQGQRLTFFTTGTVARTVPDLVRRIADDGHEIASHYNFHDPISGQDAATVERNLVESVESIQKASGQEPRGFRAPAFALPACADEVYGLIGRYFDYDWRSWSPASFGASRPSATCRSPSSRSSAGRCSAGAST